MYLGSEQSPAICYDAHVHHELCRHLRDRLLGTVRDHRIRQRWPSQRQGHDAKVDCLRQEDTGSFLLSNIEADWHGQADCQVCDDDIDRICS